LLSYTRKRLNIFGISAGINKIHSHKETFSKILTIIRNTSCKTTFNIKRSQKFELKGVKLESNMLSLVHFSL